MVLARYQFAVTDEAGNVVPAATIQVLREATGNPTVPLYSDRDGATPLGNPFQAAEDGFAAFHCVGGSYRITATSGAFSREWRYVGIGRSSESDQLLTGITWRFSTATTDSDPGAGRIKFNHATLASVSQIFADNLADLGATITSWLDTFDDGGTSLDRGTLVLQTADGSGLLIARVTGSVVDGTGYRKISITPITTAGSFALDVQVNATFVRSPVDGQDGADGEVPAARTLTAGAGLTGGGDLSANRSFAVGAGTGIVANADDVAIDKATNANVRAAASNKVITADLIESASGLVTITDGATITPDWDAFINGQITLAGNRTLAIPSNLQTGTWRSIWIQGNDGTDRTLALDAGYLGPHHAAWEALTFNSSTKRYIMSIFALNSSSAVIMGAPLGPF